VGDVAQSAVESLGNLLPYGGLLFKVAKTGISVLMEGAASADAEVTVSGQLGRARESVSDLLLQELREVFGGFGSGGQVLPTILFLDDAQWIDPDTLDFVHALWDVATQSRWPLLLVVTHREREWNLLARMPEADRHDSLFRYDGAAGAEVRRLQNADDGDLRAYLSSHCPGLTQAQQLLLLAKAAGNFWTMVLNVGALRNRARHCFVEGDAGAALTPAGEAWIAAWASQREKRIEQRFSELEPGIQDVLGWSSRAGRRFLRDTLTAFAEAHEHATAAETLRVLDACIDPLAILSAPARVLYEFRDRAFHDQGRRHFDTFLASTDEDGFARVLRDTLATWINRGFDDSGAMVAAPGSLASLSPRDARHLLAAARSELALPSGPDWRDPQCAAALRAILLSVVVDGDMGVWTEIPRLAERVRTLDWGALSDGLLATEFLEVVGKRFFEAAAYDVGEGIFEHCLRVRQRTSGPESASAATVLNNLAWCQSQKGQRAEAEGAFRRALGILEQTLGPHHPNVATTVLNLAHLYVELARHGEAEPLYERALQIFEQAHGHDDPLVATTLGSMAGLYRLQGRFQEADACFRRALAIQERVLGPDHPAVAQTLNGLALSCFYGGRIPDAAEPYYRRALQILERAFGANHPSVAMVMSNAALVHVARKEYGQAKTLFEQALAIKERTFGASHPYLASSLSNLGDWHLEQQHFTEAEAHYQRALEISEQACGSHHPDVARCLNSLAELYRQQGHHAAAEPLYRRAIEIREHVFGVNQPDVAQSLDQLATSCLQQGKYAEAENHAERALAIWQTVFGTEHPIVAYCLNGLAVASFRMRHHEDAERRFLRALQILEAPANVAQSASIPDLLDLMVLLYAEMGRGYDAEICRQRADSLRSRARQVN
jgi:tetratricopeptide (TPR) repeat protein